MKTHNTISSKRGFSAVDLLIVVAVMVVVAGIALPRLAATRCGPGRERITCINNLKQIGIGFRLHAADGAPYPEYLGTNEAWRNFQKVGRDIGSPKVLLCPKDTAKADLEVYPVDFAEPPTPTSFARPKFRNTTLSYFFNPDASEADPGSILSGDRNISLNNAIMSGMLIVETNTSVQWTEDIHNLSGNILLADGSAQQVSTMKLREQFFVSNLYNSNLTQRLLIP